MIQFLSRVGNMDNGYMEGFQGTLKSKMFYGIKWYEENKHREAITKYINFYNNERFKNNKKV